VYTKQSLNDNIYKQRKTIRNERNIYVKNFTNTYFTTL